jgi:hypothetical protein
LSALADLAAAARVADAYLLRLAERVEGRLIVDLTNVVPVVSETRRIDDAMLDAIASRCTASPDPSVRCAALELHALRGRRNVEAVEELLLRDPSPRVRGATAVHVGELLDPDVALALVGLAPLPRGNETEPSGAKMPRAPDWPLAGARCTRRRRLS